MTTKSEDAAIKAWKQQLDGALRVLEAIEEGPMKMCESQLAAATEAHASAEATRKLLKKAGDAQELWRIQGEWLSASMQASLAYWRQLYETAAETQSCAAKCFYEPAGFFASQASLPAGTSMLGMMDEAYRHWLETTKQFYAAPSVSPSKEREAA